MTPRNATADKVEQSAYRVPKDHKRHLLAHLINEGNWHQVLVFTRTKHGANRLTQQLERAGINAMAIHGNKSQNARIKALQDFKDNRITALVATEVAARGLDIKELPHVVNYELPNVPEDYVHRIGRTARAGSTGRGDLAGLARRAQLPARHRKTAEAEDRFHRAAEVRDQRGHARAARIRPANTSRTRIRAAGPSIAVQAVVAADAAGLATPVVDVMPAAIAARVAPITPPTWWTGTHRAPKRQGADAPRSDAQPAARSPRPAQRRTQRRRPRRWRSSRWWPAQRRSRWSRWRPGWPRRFRWQAEWQPWSGFARGARSSGGRSGGSGSGSSGSGSSGGGFSRIT